MVGFLALKRRTGTQKYLRACSEALKMKISYWKQLPRYQ